MQQRKITSPDESTFTKKMVLSFLFRFTKSNLYFIENNIYCEQFSFCKAISRIILGGETIIF